MFQLVDDERVLFKGTEDEMQLAYFILVWDEKTLHQTYQEDRLVKLKEKYRVPVKGKVRMLRV